MVIAKTSAKCVQSIIPNQREWLSVLVCVNAAGRAIPSFYIFRGKRFRENYIHHCEAGATMAMQPRVWMTAYLFSAWISHFVASIGRSNGISPTQRHLLIFDGHNSHITLEVARAAKNVDLDLISLPSHTSHALQPLDVFVFKPFKQFFREYGDFWMSRHINQPATKQVLAQWVSLALRKALFESNISSGFRATGIYPLDCHAVDKYLQPSETYCAEGEVRNFTSATTEPTVPAAKALGEGSDMACIPAGEGPVAAVQETAGEGCSTADEEQQMVRTPLPDRLEEGAIEAEFNIMPQSETEHFFVNVDLGDPVEEEEVSRLDPDVSAPESITHFLQLPRLAPRASSRRSDPVVDFAKSIILTSTAYEEAAMGVRAARENSMHEKARQRQEREETKKKKSCGKRRSEC
jgi:hypothetical protein